MTGLLGGLWSGTLFLIFTGDGMLILDAGIFIYQSFPARRRSFWLPVPNSCTWGSWTIMLALILLLVDEQRRLGSHCLCGRQRLHPQHYGHQLDEWVS